MGFLVQIPLNSPFFPFRIPTFYNTFLRTFQTPFQHDLIDKKRNQIGGLKRKLFVTEDGGS